MQNIAILGSTGSIGRNALKVVSGLPDRFRVVAISTNSNIALLSEQVKDFKPMAICVVDLKKAKELKRTLKGKKIRFYSGEPGLCTMLQDVKIDILLMAIVGSSALLPILTALGSVRRIALANKEALVMAGNIIMKKAGENKVKILPVDSEHSAIFQCIESSRPSEIEKIYLTGSGGPFLRIPKKYFKDLTPQQAVNHPRWKMGKKISVDSATLMNKGLEVIEAHHLFGIGVSNIQVLVHPEAVVHSMVEFIDGSMLAHLGRCDMRLPIQYALTYPSRIASPLKGISFSRLESLHFSRPDLKRFPCLKMAYEAAERGGTHPSVLNASNEAAVGEFLKGSIRFTDIPRVIEKVLSLHKGIRRPGLKDILEADEWASRKTKEILGAVRG